MPRYRKWQQVINLLASDAGAPQIASKTLAAAQHGFAAAGRDPALIHAFWLLTQLPQCARKEDYPAELAKLGLPVSAAPTLTDLIGSFSDSVDAHVMSVGRRSDLGEIAQLGAAESLAAFLRVRTGSLFGTTPEDVQREVGRLANPRIFSELARSFFARLTERYISYYVSREISIERPSVEENEEFREALAVHCRQASKIVEQYAEDWYSKANFEGGITPQRASRFVSHAMKKLRTELQMGAEGGE